MGNKNENQKIIGLLKRKIAHVDQFFSMCYNNNDEV